MKTGYRIIFFIVANTTVILFQNSAYSQGVTGTISITQATIALNLGQNINSRFEDFGACLTPDSKMLYFVSRRPSPKSSFDQIWFVQRTALDSPWSKSEYVKSLGNEYAIGGIAFDDSLNIYFATNNNTIEKNDVNIWEGEIKNSQLTIRMLPKPINSNRWECQPSITANGKDLYFASNRFPTLTSEHPKVHIYVSHKNKDGNWTEPANVGAHINIGSYNGTPFISPDGQFLFFTSNGGSNAKKIYMSSRTGLKDDDWSEAVLFPAPINSDGDSMFPMISAGAKVIFFSSNRSGGYGGYDIYSAQLPEEIHARIWTSFLGD